MRPPAGNPPPQPPGARQVARLLLPTFAASTLVMVAGVAMALAHHRTFGIVLVVLGALGGFAVRTGLMMRTRGIGRSRSEERNHP